ALDVVGPLRDVHGPLHLADIQEPGPDVRPYVAVHAGHDLPYLRAGLRRMRPREVVFGRRLDCLTQRLPGLMSFGLYVVGGAIPDLGVDDGVLHVVILWSRRRQLPSGPRRVERLSAAQTPPGDVRKVILRVPPTVRVGRLVDDERLELSLPSARFFQSSKQLFLQRLSLRRNQL